MFWSRGRNLKILESCSENVFIETDVVWLRIRASNNKKILKYQNDYFETLIKNLFCHRNSENAMIFKQIWKFLSEDLTGSWSMPEMNHLSTTREGHLNHLIFRLFIKMKKNHEWSWIELNPSWIGKLTFCQI